MGLSTMRRGQCRRSPSTAFGGSIPQRPPSFLRLCSFDREGRALRSTTKRRPRSILRPTALRGRPSALPRSLGHPAMPYDVVPALEDVLLVGRLKRVVVVDHIRHAITVPPVRDDIGVIAEDDYVPTPSAADVMNVRREPGLFTGPAGSGGRRPWRRGSSGTRPPCRRDGLSRRGSAPASHRRA